LAAILAADVAAYSRLIGADEEGTLECPKALRGELIDSMIAEHRGAFEPAKSLGPSSERCCRPALFSPPRERSADRRL